MIADIPTTYVMIQLVQSPTEMECKLVRMDNDKRITFVFRCHGLADMKLVEMDKILTENKDNVLLDWQAAPNYNSGNK